MTQTNAMPTICPRIVGTFPRMKSSFYSILAWMFCEKIRKNSLMCLSIAYPPCIVTSRDARDQINAPTIQSAVAHTACSPIAP